MTLFVKNKRKVSAFKSRKEEEQYIEYCIFRYIFSLGDMDL